MLKFNPAWYFNGDILNCKHDVNFKVFFHVYITSTVAINVIVAIALTALIYGANNLD